MPYYTVTSRTTTTQLNWRQTLQNGPLSGDRAVLAFVARKGITRVPMGYLLNGPAAQVLGTAIVTDSLFGCEAIALFGCDINDAVQHVAFSHVRGGDAQYLDWPAFTAGIIGVQPNVYAVVDSSSYRERESQLGERLQTGYNVPAANVLTYISGTSEDGRSFGVDGSGNIGEVDVRLVERNKASKLDGTRNKAGYMQQCDLFRNTVFSMKLPK